MKKVYVIAMTFLAVVLVGAGCQQPPKTTQTDQTDAAQTTDTSQPAAPAGMPVSGEGRQGSVVETMDSAGYTYVMVDTGTETIWAAAPEFKVQVGDSVSVPAGMPMPDYHSNNLDRDFDLVYFVPSISVGGAAPAAPAAAGAPADPAAGAHPTPTVGDTSEIDFTGIEKPEGGKTVGEIFAMKADLSGKEVALRGKVVKFSSMIMGKNWIHIKDGTDHEGADDLTVTTDGTASVGDTVLVNAMVTVDKDFGAGYRYDVILEDAKVTVE